MPNISSRGMIEGVYKHNLVGASKCNPGLCASVFCITKSVGDFIFATANNLGVLSGLTGKKVSMRNELEYCMANYL